MRILPTCEVISLILRGKDAHILCGDRPLTPAEREQLDKETVAAHGWVGAYWCPSGWEAWNPAAKQTKEEKAVEKAEEKADAAAAAKADSSPGA